MESPEGRRRPFEGGEAVGDLPPEFLRDRRDRRVQCLSAGHLGRITVAERVVGQRDELMVVAICVADVPPLLLTLAEQYRGNP